MRGSALGVIILLVLGALPLAAQARAAGTPALEMGYGPATLFPASDGTPVYTAGDQLWVLSSVSSTFRVEAALTSPTPGGTMAFTVPVAAGTPVRVLTFNATTPQGLWRLASLNQSSVSFPFVFSDAEDTPANLSLSSYALVKGDLRMNFTAPGAVGMYDGNACVLGESGFSGALVPLPSQVGTGFVNVTILGTSIRAALDGTLSANASLSVELYRAFSFLSPGSTSILLSRETRVATSGGAALSAVPTALSIDPEVPLRPGTYQLRAFFESSAGVSLSTADVLLAPGGSWVWLGGCRSSQVQEGSFALSVPLGSDPGAWPRSVWLTYEVLGEEALANVTLGIRISALEFVGAPWGAKLSNYTLNVGSTSGVRETGAANGTIFAILDAQTALISYGAGVGGDLAYHGTAGPLSPFTTTTVSLNVSRVVVTFLVGGSGYGGGLVRVSGRGGALLSATTGASGTATFYLPAGAYNITATGGGGAASATVSARAGETEDVTLGGGGGAGSGPLVTALLAAAAAVGGAANVGVWLRERRRGGGHRSPDANPSQK